MLRPVGFNVVPCVTGNSIGEGGRRKRRNFVLAECGEKSPKLGGNTDRISALSVSLRAFLNAIYP